MTPFPTHRSLTMFFVIAAAAAGTAADPTEIARIQARTTWSYVVFAVTVSVVKIVAMVLGFLVAKLGFTTMMAGVQGKDSVLVGPQKAPE